jgi:hypothetical protein
MSGPPSWYKPLMDRRGCWWSASPAMGSRTSGSTAANNVANTRWWPPFCLVVDRVTERNRIGPVGTFPARFGRGRRNTPPLNEAGVFD